MISIVLVEPEIAGNIGAVCRTMKNFDFSNLVIVNTKCDCKSTEVKNRAKHAQDILRKAKLVKRIPKFDYVIGTTAKLGSDYNVNRLPLLPEQLAKKLAMLGNKIKIGILFGREGIGLTNKEIEKCDLIVTIPSSKTYPTLNLSHSVAVVLYELFKVSGKETKLDRINPAQDVDKKQILKMLNKILGGLKFSTKEKKSTQKLVWKRIINKAFLTKREAFVVMGLFRKLIKKR
tara:strand:+ start:7752 stop:8447 length:696 start_codon:yes stop_codon:yes gene_type:complete